MSLTGAVPELVLAAYGLPHVDVSWRCVDSGFSGALIFAGPSSAPSFAFRLYPLGVDPAHVESRHLDLMKLSGLPFIPRVIASRHGRTCTVVEGRLWELSTWQPGTPAQDATPRHIVNACTALAQMHRAWREEPRSPAGNCLRDRVDFVNESMRTVARLPKSALRLRKSVQDAASLLSPIDSPIPSQHPFPAQLIHGDLHRDHVLFTGSAVTGVIDFASIKRDHPAVDLARYLGDEIIETSVEAYRNAGGCESVTPEVVHYVNRVLTLGAAAHWIQRLVRNEVPAASIPAATARLERIVARLRTWPANAVSTGASFS